MSSTCCDRARDKLRLESENACKQRTIKVEWLFSYSIVFTPGHKPETTEGDRDGIDQIPREVYEFR